MNWGIDELRKQFGKKGFTIVITIFFISMNVISCIGVAHTEKQTGTESADLEGQIIMSHDQDVYPLFNGTIGENGWFISPVNVTFVYDPQIVKTIYYRYNASTEEYTGPFIISMQGRISFWYSWIDYGGNIHGECGPFDIGIDYTPPEITFWIPKNNTLYLFDQKLFQIQGISIIIGGLTVDVAASDEYAGLTNVSCTLTNAQNTITHVFDSIPFLWKLKGIHIGTYTLSATSYNWAGLHASTTLQMRMLQFGLFQK
jgi:hypothetical protein